MLIIIVFYSNHNISHFSRGRAAPTLLRREEEQQMRSMSSLVCCYLSVFALLLLFNGAVGFNLDPSSPTIVVSSSGLGREELFGFSLAQHGATDGTNL